jgi:tRNA G18 (ribose-2'-O)-methylase SpoU
MDIVGVLVNIRSLHNTGSIFRTADGAGVRKIYLAGITPEPSDRLGKLRGDFAKVALGAEKSVPFAKVTRALPLLKKLRKEGYAIFAVEQDKRSVPYYAVKAPLKIALVMGSEVEGLPRPVLKAADSIIEIPMQGEKESLNVGVAFGIVAYHFAAQR